jgi:predicted small metal-binding protein
LGNIVDESEKMPKIRDHIKDNHGAVIPY